MQLICHFATAGYDSWKSAFDAEAETTAAAGLRVMQIWHGADDPAQVSVLFTVAERKRAQEWLANAAARGQTVTAHFVTTV